MLYSCFMECQLLELKPHRVHTVTYYMNRPPWTYYHTIKNFYCLAISKLIAMTNFLLLIHWMMESAKVKDSKTLEDRNKMMIYPWKEPVCSLKVTETRSVKVYNVYLILVANVIYRVEPPIPIKAPLGIYKVPWFRLGWGWFWWFLFVGGQNKVPCFTISNC
jgi:hypothetical protein